MKQPVLTNDNILIYAAQNYINPHFLTSEEFYEDFARFKYLKKLLTRYENTNVIQERLMLNHLIKIYNVFNMSAATEICKFKIPDTQWPILKTLLMYLNYATEYDFLNIAIDIDLEEKLLNI